MALSIPPTLKGSVDLANTTPSATHDGTLDCGTVTNGAMLIVTAAGTVEDVAAASWTTPTKNSGAATIGTVTQVGDAGTGQYTARVTVWRIPVTAGGTLVLNVGDTAGASEPQRTYGAMWRCYEYTDQDATTPVAGAVGQWTGTDDGNLANSTLGATPAAADHVFAVVNFDSDEGAGKALTAGTDFTELHENGDAAGDYLQTSTNGRAGSVSTSTTVVWPTHDGTPNTYSGAGVVFIVKAAAGATTGSGTPSQAAQTSAGTGTITLTGSGTPTQAAQTAAGTGTHSETITGSGTPSQAAQTSSGSGTSSLTLTGSGTPSQAAQTAAGTGTQTISGSGTPSQAAQIAAGTGLMAAPRNGSGAITQAAQTSTGVGQLIAGLWPTSVSGREILDQNSDPYPVKGVAVWTATQNLTDAEITTLLEGVAAHGFNSVLMAPCGLLWNINGGAGNRYENEAGADFFTGTPFQSSLGAAWSSVDHFIDEALRLELTVWFCWYAGFASTYGIADEISAASDAQCRTTGAAVAARYPHTSYPNLVWVFGADREFTPGSTVGLRLDSICRGVEDNDTVRLWAGHPAKRDDGGSTSAFDQFGTGYTYLDLDINGIYSYQDAFADHFDSVYAEAAMPVINVEPVYVHNTGTAISAADIGHASGGGEHIREQAWVSFVRGGNGIMFGDEDLWPFDAAGLFDGGGTWQQVLDHPAGTHDNPMIWLSHLWDFLIAHSSWADIAPDADTFLTSGEGTGAARAAAGFTGDLGVVYFPGSRASIVVNTTLLTGTANVRLRWFDPTNGAYTTIAASEAQSSSRSVTYPSSNSNSNSADDWVLVVELLTDATGSGTPSQAPQTAAGSGTISFTATGTPTQAAQTAAGSGTETLTGSGAPSQAAQTSSGTGSETFTATGTPSQLAQTATGTGIAGTNPTGIGNPSQAAQTADGTGTLTLTFTATGSPSQAAQTATGAGTSTLTGSGAMTQAAQVAAGVGRFGDFGPPTMLRVAIVAAELRVVQVASESRIVEVSQ